MHIRGFHVEGFGILHDIRVDDMPRGLVLVTGDNESGKTTLMEFLRSILFGYRRGGPKTNAYDPFHGGQRGGRLDVVMADGRPLTIERLGRSVSILRDDGSVTNAEPSEHLFGGIDRQTYEGIFAVGLKELDGLKVLGREEVQGRLLAAGAGAGAAHVPDAIQTLANDLESLLKKSKRATTPYINPRLTQISELEAEIRELEKLPHDYSELNAELTRLEDEARRLREEAATLRRRLHRFEQQTQALAPWIDLSEARTKLEPLASATEFPPDGIVRFERLSRDVEDASAHREQLADELELLEQQRSGITLDTAVFAIAEQVKAFRGERNKYETALDDFPNVFNSRIDAEQTLELRLNELGPEWDTARLESVDASLQARQTAQRFARQVEDAERPHHGAVQELERATERLNDETRRAEQAQDAFERTAQPPIKAADELRAKRGRTNELRRQIEERDRAAETCSFIARELDAIDQRLADLATDVSTRAIPSWVWKTVFIGGLGTLALAGVSLAQQPVIGALLVIVSAAATMTGLALRRQRLRTVHDEGDESRRRDDEARSTAELRRERDGEHADLRQRIEYAEEIIQALSTELEIEPTIDSVERLSDDLEQMGERLSTWITAKAEVERAASELKQAEQTRQRAAARVQESVQALESARSDWQTWITARGFSDDVRPEDFGEILQAIERTRDAQKTLRERDERVRSIRSYVEDVSERLRHAFRACGEEIAESSTVDLTAMDALIRRLEREDEGRAELRQIEVDVEGKRRDLRRAQAACESTVTERSELLERASARDEDTFREASRCHDDWQRYDKQRDQSMHDLQRIIGHAEEFDTFTAELDALDPASLEEARRDASARLDEIDEDIGGGELVDANRRIGEVSTQLSDMAQDERLGELRQRREGLRAEMAKATRRWLTGVLCRSFLTKAQAVYERERQPNVIKKADRFLRIMTSRQYRLVQPPGEADAVQLEDGDSLRRRDELIWSSGLADQIFLSVRLGLAHEFANHAEPLPIILDDVLAKFDATRRLGAVCALLDMAEQHQVFLFSCDRALRDVLEQAVAKTGSQAAVAHYAVEGGHVERLAFP